MLERGHPVDEAGLGGGVAGAEPPHKGGPNRPDRPKGSGQWSVDGGMYGGSWVKGMEAGRDSGDG